MEAKMGNVKNVWLADVLRAAGLKVIEEPGWKTRGGDMGRIKGIICHHTAGGMSGNFPSLGVVKNGRPGLSGPLSQLGLGRDGTFYVIAAGRSNHAGRGAYKGIKTGNTNFIGIEAENTGYEHGPRAEAWSKEEMDAYKTGVAAILLHLGLTADMCIGHKEWAPTRKTDPTFDMVVFRKDVEEIMKKINPIITKPVIIQTPTSVVAKAITLNIKDVKIDPNALFGPERNKYAFNYMKSLGWNGYQSAAIVAQAIVNSNMITGENGIMKWSDVKFGLLKSRNVKYDDLISQLTFVDWELRNSETQIGNALKESKDLMEALRVAVGYVKPVGWSKENPENTFTWKERVFAALSVMD